MNRTGIEKIYFAKLFGPWWPWCINVDTIQFIRFRLNSSLSSQIPKFLTKSVLFFLKNCRPSKKHGIVLLVSGIQHCHAWTLLIFGVVISLAIVNIKGNLVIKYLISLLTKSCSRGMQLSKLNCENLTRRFFSHRRILFTPLRYISWLPWMLEKIF